LFSKTKISSHVLAFFSTSKALQHFKISVKQIYYGGFVNNKKMGFWTLFAIITGSQIGSGALLLPSKLSVYGYFSLFGWIVSAIGAIALALVFARLSALKKEKGGPHALVLDSLGFQISYFVGWTYWVISWASMTAVVSACGGYFSVFLGIDPNGFQASLIEIAVLLSVFLINWFGVSIAGRIELFLTVVKFVPLAVIPLFCFLFLTKTQFSQNFLQPPALEAPFFHLVSQIALLTLWGFIGFETGTAPAEAVENPKKTIPKAIVISTITVAVVYILNNIGLASFVARSDLSTSQAPYALVTQKLFGGQIWSSIIALISGIVCFGTLNAWIIASTQIALNLRKKEFLPKWLGLKNQYDIPKYALIVATMGIGLILLVMNNQSYGDKLTTAVTYAVTSFLLIYLICCVSALLDHVRKRIPMKMGTLLYHLFALGFCLWVLIQNPFMNTVYALVVPLTGLPFFFLNMKKMASIDLALQNVRSSKTSI
jgi:APA family basic amino acid/polyamine antiporter